MQFAPPAAEHLQHQQQHHHAEHYDPDAHFDSSSSSGDGTSSDSHSSPADSSYSATSTGATDWAIDFGLAADPHTSAFAAAAAAGVKLAPRVAPPAAGAPHAHDGLSLPSDFWSAAPGHAALSPRSLELAAASADGTGAARQEPQPGRVYFGGAGGAQQERMEMDFDDMVHGDVCGPSTLTSPTHTMATPLSAPAFSVPTASAAPPLAGSFLAQYQNTSQQPPVGAPPLSMPVDLFAVNAGIAPSLTSAQTPSPLHSPASEFPLPAQNSAFAPSTRSSSVGRGGARSSIGGTSTRDASLSRQSDGSTSSSSAAPAPAPPTAPSSAARAVALATGGTTVNLVARDAVQAAHLIPAHAAPSPAAVAGAELLVLGVPRMGAKSRVETQIKISLALVRPRGGVKLEQVGGRVSDEMVMADGGLDARAAEELERLGSWTHLRLPKHLALKSKPGKQLSAAAAAKKVKPEPAAEHVLSVDVAVVSATNPSQRIFICQNCQARELKRSLRKKDAKGKTYTAAAPQPDADAPPRNEEDERKKVVVFNSTELVEFTTGEVVLPTRVTCYCRHHKEKRGFCVTYVLRDFRGNVVATGMTPPIMITDDHKTTTAAKVAAASLAAGLPADEAPAPPPAPAANKRKASKSTPAPARKERKDKSSSPAGSATASASASASAVHASGRLRRGAATRSRRGQTESDDDAQEASKKARPYDAEQRPVRSGARRVGSAAASRSPTFAMTPLRAASPVAQPTGTITPQTMEGIALPPLPPLQTEQQQQLASPGSALGLGGMEDALMADSPAQQQQPSGLVSYLASGARRSISSDPVQAQIDWRANLSTPPMSPGSTAPSESYHSLFSGFPSPVGSLVDPAPAPVPALAPTPSSSIPSFAIPATEPIPTSLTPSWTIPQQPQQLFPPALPPRITRLIPGEGPVHGGIEVTVLGENFVQDLTCVFGDSAAVPTHFWSSNTLVCVLPPSANPGPVVVGIKGVPLTVEQGTGLQLFTYKDDSDRSLLELALQVVGLKMTGRLEDAAAVAMRIVGNGPNGAGGAAAGLIGGAGAGAHGAPRDTAALAATLNAAATSVYATPATSRASSRRSSVSGNASPGGSTVPLPALPGVATGETRGFEGIVIKFLSLLDLDPSLIPGAAPSLPSTRPPISHANAQQHTLLHLATVLGFHRLVAFLLARGVALDAADRNGYTALHFAALYGRVSIARQLLDAGADVRVRTRAGKAPLEIALDRDDVDVEELLRARGASDSPATMATPTPRDGGMLLASPAASSSARLSELSDADEDEEDDARTEYASDWTVDSLSDTSSAFDSDDDDDREGWDSSDAHYADESAQDETSPVRRPRTPRSRQVSRNASTVSLHYLVETEQEIVEPKRSPRFRRASLPTTDDIPAGEPVPVATRAATPLNHLASASSAWLSQKLKPTVQPGLNKLQPLAGGVTGAWEKAKANRFGVPQMHIPELTAFHAMPAALTRHMSSGSGSGAKSKRRRAATLSETRSAGAEAGAETDLGDEADESSAPLERSTLRDWRAAFQAPAWWHSASKTPSSPPPQYTARDELSAAAAAAAGDEKVVDAAPVASSSSAVAVAPRVGAARMRFRRRTSAASQDSDETEADAESDAGSTFSTADAPHRLGIRSDPMLAIFWLPVLVVALYFAYTSWATQVQPVLDTFLDTVFPQALQLFRR
ncbi:SPT3 Dosage dependent suppressor of Ty-induced promoter mutations-like protein [Rhodotorula kratochvilovae]